MKRLLFLMLTVSAITSCNETAHQPAKVKDIVTKDTITAPAVYSPGADTAKMPPAENDSILPGKSIGLISIDEKMESVTAKLGRPDAGDAAMGKAVSIWHSKRVSNDSNIVTIYSSTNFGDKEEAPRVQMIRVTSPFFKTAQKAGSGSTIAFIKIIYPSLKRAGASYTDTALQEKILIYDDVKEGISFEINSSGKCIATAIHKTGKPITAGYLSLFPALKIER